MLFGIQQSMKTCMVGYFDACWSGTWINIACYIYTAWGLVFYDLKRTFTIFVFIMLYKYCPLWGMYKFCLNLLPLYSYIYHFLFCFIHFLVSFSIYLFDAGKTNFLIILCTEQSWVYKLDKEVFPFSFWKPDKESKIDSLFQISDKLCYNYSNHW